MSNNLNICIVHPNRNAYSETFIRNHINFLPANIYDTYGSWWPTFDGKDRRLLDNYKSRSVISRLLYYMSRLIPFIIFARLSSRITCWPMQDEKLHAATFRHYLQTNKIKAVLAEYGVIGTVVYSLCAEMGIPLIIHFHGYDAHHKPTLKGFRDDYKKMFATAGAIIVVSQLMKQKLLELGAPIQKLHLNYYGIDTSLFAVCDPSLNPRHFVSVGRFTDKKAPHLTILAFRKVAVRYRDSVLFFIGDGELLEACINLSASLGLEAQVFFEGMQPPAIVAKKLAGCRAFVMHSITTSDGDTEGTPNAVIEAMAVGLPIISTLHAGIQDIVTDGVNGFLVNEKDIDSMSEKMIQLIENPQQARHMGRNGRKYVEENLDLQKSINSLYQIIESVIKKSDA